MDEEPRSILQELKKILDDAHIPNEVGVFTAEPAPATFAVVIPLNEIMENADNRPVDEVQAARVAIYAKGNYRATARTVAEECIDAWMCVTDRRYIEHEDDTGYHHYEIEVEKNYKWEE